MLFHKLNQKSWLQVKKCVFLLIFCGHNGFDNIAVNVTSLEKLLDLASDILDIPSQDVSLFLFVDGTLIDDNEYLKTLPV